MTFWDFLASIDLLTKSTICLSVLSFVLAVVSIFIANATIKQNNQMIESATRPSLSVFLFSTPGTLEISLKNTGNSDAIITELTHDANFSICSKGHEPFANIEGAVIPPQHYMTYVVAYREFFDENDDTITIHIDYSSRAGKSYSDVIELFLPSFRCQAYSETTINEKNWNIQLAKNSERLLKDFRLK